MNIRPVFTRRVCVFSVFRFLWPPHPGEPGAPSIAAAAARKGPHWKEKTLPSSITRWRRRASWDFSSAPADDGDWPLSRSVSLCSLRSLLRPFTVSFSFPTIGGGKAAAFLSLRTLQNTPAATASRFLDIFFLRSPLRVFTFAHQHLEKGCTSIPLSQACWFLSPPVASLPDTREHRSS